MVTGLLLKTCSAAFLIEPRISSRVTAAPTMSWALPHPSLFKKCLAGIGEVDQRLRVVVCLMCSHFFVLFCFYCVVRAGLEFSSTCLVLKLPKLRYAFRYFGKWDFLGNEVGETVVTDRRRDKKA